MKTKYVHLALLFVLLLAFHQVSAQLMIKDINPSGSSGISTTDVPSNGLNNPLVVYNNKTFFGADDGTHGHELWISDGTTAGTKMLKDINPGPAESSPHTFILYNDKLYFYAIENRTGRELWVTDGTTAGTQMVKDLIPGVHWSVPYHFPSAYEIIQYNNKIFFSLYDAINLQGAIGVTDGTSGGTQILKHMGVRSEPVEHIQPEPVYLTICHDKLYFSVQTDEGGELWISDGTTEGTYALVAFDHRPSSLIAYQDKLYFYGISRSHGSGIWVSDGTLGGTYLFSDKDFGEPIVFRDKLIFTSNAVSGVEELWESDGTEEGTRFIASIGDMGRLGGLNRFRILHDKLYFSGHYSTTGRELWVSDGTTEGTFMVKDIYPGSRDGFWRGTETLFPFNGQIYFAGCDPVHGTELWITDGTREGTYLVKDIYRGGEDSDLRKFVEYERKMYFSADNGSEGSELWVSDGTSTGTYLMKDINNGPDHSNIDGFTIFNGNLLFTAFDNAHGNELWKFDGVNSSHIASDCPENRFSLPPGRPDAPLAFIDYLCFHIDYKIVFGMDECLYCHAQPCFFCTAPCLTCPDAFKEFGYAYEVTFSYENPSDKEIYLPIGKRNFFNGISEQHVGQPEIFKPGYHENVFSVIAAPGQKLEWMLTDEEGNQRNFSYTLPAELVVKVFPNPNEGLFTVTIAGIEGQKQEAHMSISNERGDIISEQKVLLPAEEKLTLQEYGKGLYFIKVSIGTKSITEKVLVE